MDTNRFKRRGATLVVAAAVIALPNPGGAARTQPRPFDARVLISSATVAPTDDCATGIESSGFALDVRDGTFDGFWWNSTCFFTDGSASGTWWIYYIGGQITSALAGRWESTTAAISGGGISYSGSYELTEAYGPWTGTTGAGSITLTYGPQVWIAMAGHVIVPS